mgnify:CR=1 FL=1
MATDCQGTLDELNRFLDQEMSPEQRAEIMEHLAGCTDCQQTFDFHGELKRVVRLIAAIALGVGGLFFAVSLLLGNPPSQGFIFAVGVTVALVPEGLLPTVTLSLAIGASIQAFGLFVLPVSAELHLTRAQVNTGAILFNVGMAVVGPVLAVEYGLSASQLGLLSAVMFAFVIGA